MNKIEAEFAAGDPQPDVLLVANSLVMDDLKERRPADGLSRGAGPTASTRRSTTPTLTYFGTKLITTGHRPTTTDLVAEAPTSWTDLTSDDAGQQR